MHSNELRVDFLPQLIVPNDAVPGTKAQANLN